MANNIISKEKLMNYICNELSSEESSQIEQLLKTDEALKLQYDEIMQLRNLHAETMIPLLNPIMPAKTQTLINSLKKSETKSWSKFLSLGPLAVAGWIGFAAVGSMQVASLIEDEASDNSIMFAEIGLENNMRSASSSNVTNNKKDPLSSLIKNMDKTFTVGETFTIYHDISIGDSSVKSASLLFKVQSLIADNEKTCVDFEIRADIQDPQIITEQICISHKK